MGTKRGKKQVCCYEVSYVFLQATAQLSLLLPFS